MKKITILLLSLVFLIFSFRLVPLTNSYFVAQQSSVSNKAESEDPPPELAGGGDSSAPETTLDIEDSGTISQAIEQIDNGSFETGGSIANWAERGNVERLANEFETISYDDDQMAKIGQSNHPSVDSGGNEVWLNGLGQSISSGSKNLSFWYNFYTYEYTPFFDEPGFSVVINGRSVFDIYAFDIDYYQGDYYDSGYDDSTADTYATGWQQTFIDLTQFGDTSLGMSFYAGNTGDEWNQSWVYLDKVTTTKVTANENTQFLLSTENGAEIYYQVQPNDGICQDNDSVWQLLGIKESSFNLLTYGSGDYTVYYRSIDEVGNKEIPNSIKVHLDKEKPEDIIDLEATPWSSSSVKFLWDTPADILGVNRVRAVSYDMRYWEKEEDDCDTSGWDLAKQVKNPPVPRFPDELQDFEIKGLKQDTVYCFAIKTCDNAFNCSDISTNEYDDIVSVATNPIGTPPAIKEGDVVINELMWMGSSESSADEWIELKNTTDEEIDLSNFELTKNTGTEQKLNIDMTGKTIKPNGYFLIANYNKIESQFNITPDLIDISVDLHNEKLEITLYSGKWDDGGVIIDIAGDGGRPFNYDVYYTDGHYWSMERNEELSDGTDPNSWHACEDALTTIEYWDKDAVEQGTPGGKNRSDNELKVEFSLFQDKESVKFKVFNILDYANLDYEITYEPSNRAPQGIGGSIALEGQKEIAKDDLMLGTDSSGDWVWDEGMDKIYLKVKLTGEGMPERTLEKEIIYQ